MTVMTACKMTDAYLATAHVTTTVATSATAAAASICDSSKNG
jgi:hypothetical protein